MGLGSFLKKAAGVVSDVVGIGSGISSVAGLLGGSGEPSTRQVNAANADLQREFAQQGIRWRVEDAKAAGLHPLAALGVQPFNPTASYVGGGNSTSERWANAGNGIARAVSAGSTAMERLSERLLESQIKGQEIDNAFRASELARTTGAQMNPPFPGRPGILVKPSEITTTRPGDRATELAGPAPAVKEFINRDGTVTSWPSKDARDSIEDSIIYEMEHFIKNRITPGFREAWNDTWWNPKNAKKYFSNRKYPRRVFK